MSASWQAKQQIAETLGITPRAVSKRAQKDGWLSKHEACRGGNRFLYKFDANGMPITDSSMSLPQSKNPHETDDKVIPLFADDENPWEGDALITDDLVRDRRVQKWSTILREVNEVPSGWKKSKWLNAVALKHNTTRQTIYKMRKKYEQCGLAGLKHTKRNKGKAKAWDEAALDYWVGLCLKKEHRKVAKDALYYEVLMPESTRNRWRIGSYESALQWFKKRTSPQLTAFQKGGRRALDNLLPPVHRLYNDLEPFDILVGDQHRFDFWVMDDETGELFRPEGFFWQDLRSRCFYGGAVDKKYDSFLIGLALRVGINIFGAFKSIYTDHGRPELSKYVMSILAEMRGLGLNFEQTSEGVEAMGGDEETINPFTIEPGTHRKAIVRNAKAKMIEGTFNVLEGIMRDHMRLPGYCKRLNDLGEYQDIDQQEVEALAKQGKLASYSEFVFAMYKAMNYYNENKHHRGVKKEWLWKPAPKTTTPMNCLEMCVKDGWRPVKLDRAAVDLVFLAKVSGGRIADRGQVRLRNRIYVHDKLIPPHC